MPNPPADDVPSGGEEDFEVLREIGHEAVVRLRSSGPSRSRPASRMARCARGTKASGSRFVYRLGDLALLEMALYRYAFTRVTEQSHIPMLPPVLVREEAMYGTGFFPTDAVNIYGVEGDASSSGSGRPRCRPRRFMRGEFLAELPLRYVVYSTCFRREAGAAGKDTRGMFRVHQFDKVEMFVDRLPEASAEEHERLLNDRGRACQGARPALPRDQRRGWRSRSAGGEEI